MEKREGRWQTWCRALPQCRGEGKNQRQAYLAIKRSIRHYLEECLRQGKPIPMDRTTTKFYRVDVRDLRASGELH